MYFEKWGFMLIFWNLAGVPLSYCHCTLYIANHDPSEYHWNPYLLTLLFVTYLFVYWIWDTANSQKNMFRAQERGVALNRKTFPQLPWKAVKNPVSIKTKTGDSILCDGWCKCAFSSWLHPLSLFDFPFADTVTSQMPKLARFTIPATSSSRSPGVPLLASTHPSHGSILCSSLA
jgi:hypothetical protein